MPGGTKRSISSEISKPQISAAGSRSRNRRAKAALAAAHVEYALPGQRAQVLADQLHVEMRGSMVEGKCSSSRDAASNEA